MAAEMTAEEYRAAQEAEYSQYRANKPIRVDGVPAFNEGDLVPAGHVKRGVVDKADVDSIKSEKKEG